jgi:autotransporter-associated beta strand protein
MRCAHFSGRTGDLIGFNTDTLTSARGEKLPGRKVLGRKVGRRAALAIAIAAGAASYQQARGDRTWVGGVVAFLPPSRAWVNNANWDLGIPTPVDNLFFNEVGEGAVDLGGVTQTNPTVTFGDWVTYTLDGAAASTLQLTGATAPQISVGNTVQSTYGSDYFANGNVISTGLDLESPGGTTMTFTGVNGGDLLVSGPITGPSALTLTNSAALGTGELFLSNPNAAYGGPVTIGPSTAVRLLDGGRAGIGSVVLNGGRFDILSSTGPQAMGNTIDASSGTVSADLNYSDAAVPPPAPTTDKIGPVVVDGAAVGSASATITFQADNEFNFESPGLFLENVDGIAGPTRTVFVKNGDLRSNIDGSTEQTGPNNLNRIVVTSTMDSLFDLTAGGGGLALTKAGGGVLAIGGGNETTSEGLKFVFGGTLRFLTAKSYGTTTGLVGGPPVAVTLEPTGGPTVSAAMGIGYATPVPGNLMTVGGIPGQSGAFDVDLIGDPAPVVLPIVNIGGGLTSLRLGSSGTGVLTGAVTPYTIPGGPSTYYLGGGGGSLTITAPLLPGPPGPAATSMEMGTTGTLLPGLVELTAPIAYTGSTSIKAGTLQIPGAGILKPTAITHVGTYSTLLTTGSAYSGAPAGTPYDGPGQLLLASAGGFGAYGYGPGGSFGAGGLSLDGGTVGYDGSIVLPAIPATAYGAAIPSELYQSKSAPLAPIATHILSLGGEHSAGTMTVVFPIANVAGVPVALLKSGIGSVLDLTALPGANTATGGTGIMGGEVKVDLPTQLGPAAIVITDGGILHVAPGGGAAVPFTQILRVANGPQLRGSVVNVDAGVFATFDKAPLEADAEQSVLEKTGAGTLDLLPAFLYPSSDPSNTWGLKMDSGVVEINQLPGVVTPANGEAIFAGSTVTPAVLHVEGPASPSGIPIPAAVQYSPNYGFSGISTYAGTFSQLAIDDKAFFRVDGFNPSNYMGNLLVTMGPSSVFKVSGAPGGGALDTSGTGSIDFSGGNVQFTPTDAHALLPQDGAFSLHLNGTAAAPVLFSGCANTNLNGNLYFNDDAGSSVVQIDAATVDNTPTPFASTWTISASGLTSWNGSVFKESTQAVPGGGGPFTTGTVVFNRSQGAPVNVAAGSVLQIDAGVVDADGTADPFTDNSTGPTSGNHVAVVNNPVGGFEVTKGVKVIASLTGTGTTSITGGSTLRIQKQTVYPVNAQMGLTIDATSTLDLTNNKMFINYGATPDPVAAIRLLLISGRAGGWTGVGIDSSSAAASGGAYSVGYVDSVDGVPSPGLGVHSIKLDYALNGDCNLDGIVNGTDFAILASHFGQAAPRWDAGDFNYDGVVNGTDFAMLAANFGLTTNGTAVVLPQSQWAALDAFAVAHGLQADVPEPGSAAVVAAGLAGALGRRKRRRSL